MNQSWSDYDSDWFVSLNSTATDIVVIFLFQNRQIMCHPQPEQGVLSQNLDSGSGCSATKTMDVDSIHLYHLPSHLLHDCIGYMLHIWYVPPMHLPVSCTSISTHEHKALGMAVPVQRRHVAQLRIVVGILVLLIIRMYYIGYQIDRIGLPKR